MYTPERRPFQSAIAALLFASIVTFATVAPEQARADGGKSGASCVAASAMPQAPRHFLA
jgi:hypothetical protein